MDEIASANRNVLVTVKVIRIITGVAIHWYEGIIAVL
jgi:hypothetical protein